MKNKFLIRSFFFISLFLFSCQRLPTELNVYLRQSIFPLTVGSTWTYEVGEVAGNAYRLYDITATVLESTEINGKIAYSTLIVTPEDQKQKYYAVHRDSIFELQYNFNQPVWALKYLIPRNTRETFYSLIGGDVSVPVTVTRLDTLIQTPAGDFRQCYQFVQNRGSYIVEEYLVMGVGLVKSITYWSTSKQIIQIKALKSFNIAD